MSCAPSRSACSARPWLPTRLFALSLSKSARSALHFATGLTETLAGLDAHALKPLLDFAQLLAERLLLGAQLFQRFLELLCRHLVHRALLAALLLVLLPLARILRHVLAEQFVILALKRVAALHAVTQGLIELERLIHQLLLLLHQFAKLVHLLAHFAVFLALLLLLRTAGLQVVHHPLHLGQHLARLILGAGLRQILDLVHHFFQILLAQRIVLFRPGRHLRVFHCLLGQRLHVFLHGVPQFLHQLGDFLVGGTLFERIGQGLLRIAQATVRQRQVAVLDAERDFPEMIGGIAQHVVVVGHFHAAAGRLQQKVMGQVRDVLVRTDHDGIIEVKRPGELVGIKGKDLPLLGNGAGQRLEELTARKHHILGNAAALLAGGIAGNQRDPHAFARKRMFAEIAARQPLGVASIAARQVEAIFWQRIERPCIRGRRFERLDLRPGLLQAVIVLGKEPDFQRGIDGAARQAVKGDLRHAVGNDREFPLAFAHIECAVAGDLVKVGLTLCRRWSRRAAVSTGFSVVPVSAFASSAAMTIGAAASFSR